MLAQSMRPKFKADTYYMQMPDGVYLRGNSSRLVLKGKSLYPLLAHLVPNLNGNVTLAEITEGLDADRKRMVTHLIEKLYTHQLLKDTSQDQRDTLQPLEHATYAPDITFIDSLQNSAASRFARFREQRLLLIGSGPGFTSLVQASLQCGIKQVSVLLTQEEKADLSSHQDVLATDVNDASAQMIAISSWEDEAEVRKTIQSCDAILHIADRSLVARAQLFNRLCIEERKTFIQAILDGERAWLGPLVCPETGACWECAWRRLQANVPELADDFSATSSSGRLLTVPGATIIANRLLFALFQQVTQTSSLNTGAQLSELDLTTYLSESHAFLPHPHCLASQHPVAPTASQFLEQIQQLRQQPPIDADSFMNNVAGCVDRRLGLFTAFENDDFVQVPLAVYRVRLANPALADRQHASLDVIATGVDTREASASVLRKACVRYAASCVESRRLLPLEAVSQHATLAIASEQLVGETTRPSEDNLWSWALDVQTDQASLVPASAVFSVSGEEKRGIASGQTWEEALCLAVLDWCNCLTVAHMLNAQQVYPQVDLNQTPMTRNGEHLSRLLKATGKQITVYDITGPLGVPTFATCLDAQVVAYTTHCDGAQALSTGLEQAVQQYQAEHFQQPDYAPAPVPDFPQNLRGVQMSLSSSTSPDAWSDRLAWLLERLQANGLRAFAIPLDHDPALVRTLPFIARVLLSKRELKKEV